MNKYLWILIISLIVITSCSKEVQMANVESIRDYKLNTKDSLFIHEEVTNKDNYIGLSKETISELMSHYMDTVDLQDYIPDPVLKSTLMMEMITFYKILDHQMAWSNGKKPSSDAKFILSKLAVASEEGLNPLDYGAFDLLELQGNTYDQKRYINIYELIEYDLKLTGALLTYAWHLENGRIDPKENDWRWAIEIPKEPVAARLASALNEKNLKNQIEDLVPKHGQYVALKKALEDLRRIEHKGGWPVLPSDLKLRQGDVSEFTPLLRERLIATDDLKKLWKNNLNNTVFDEKLKEALAKFQQRHGLEADGILGKETLNMLNMSVEEKIAITEINMERLRWLPNNIQNNYLLVNLPEYKLKVFEKNKEVWDMKVIVGKSYKHATPIFHDEIEYVVFSPTWGVPKKIVRNEIMPKVQSDPGFLKRNGYKLYVSGSSGPVDPYTVDWTTSDLDVRVIQSSGPNNALGLVKFIMPNRFNIYLHDTPTDYLFNRTERDFSHGCVRLEKPKELAEYLLKNDKEWDSYRIEEHMYKDYASTVWLEDPMPVYIVYQTAFIGNDGSLNFRKDIYNHDKNQTELIASRYLK